MRKLLIVAISSSLYASTVWADSFTIAAGGPSGQYTRVICPAVATAMQARGFEVKCKTTSGSGENFSLVNTREVNAGLIQKDALFGLINSSGDPQYQRLLPLGDLTPEAVWMVVLNPERGGRVPGFETFTQRYTENTAPERPLVIGVAGNQDSGSYITLQNGIVNSLPELKQNIAAGYVKLRSLENTSPTVAYNYLGHQMDAVMFVQMPDLENPRLKTVLDSGGKFNFIGVTDQRLTRLKIAGQSIYQLAEIPLQGSVDKIGGRLQSAWRSLVGEEAGAKTGKSLRTVITQATLLVDPQVTDARFVEALSEAANANDLLPQDSVAGIAARWWANMKNASHKLLAQ